MRQSRWRGSLNAGEGKHSGRWGAHSDVIPRGLGWAGGAGTYVLERRASLGPETVWVEVPLATPTDSRIHVPLDGAAGFFRVFRVE